MHTESGGGVNPAQIDLGEPTVLQCGRYREAPPPYSPPTPGGGAVITEQPIVHQTIIVQAPLKANALYYNCPKCMERVYTKVNHVTSQKTHLIAGFICGCTMWCLMCCLGLIPYFVKTFKKTEHYCPNCETLLGTYSLI